MRECNPAISYRSSNDTLLKTALHLVGVALVGFLAYSNTFHVPFVLDDIAEIQNNQTIQDLNVFFSHYSSRRFIGYLSFALNYYFTGNDLTAFHVTNLLIHILTAWLVYFFVTLILRTAPMRSLRQSTAAGMMPFFTALLFVSHPVQTQAVTYIVQRLASLATLFYLLAIVCYIQARFSLQKPDEEQEKRSGRGIGRGIIWFSLCLASAWLAILTKEIAYTLPISIMLVELTFISTRLHKKHLIMGAIGLIIASTVLFIALSERSGDLLSRLDQLTRETTLSRTDYLLTEMRVVMTYIRLVFVPIHQNLDYDYPIYRTFFSPAVLGSFVFLVSLFGLGVFLLRKARTELGEQKEGRSRSSKNKQPKAASPSLQPLAPYYRLMGFGIIWFFITLSIESSIIPIDDVIFEHRLYLPLVGLLTALTAGLIAGAVVLKKEKAIWPLLAVLTLTLSAAAYSRNAVWADSRTLWEDVVRKGPNYDRPHNNLGTVYYNQERIADALREFQTAVQLNPGYADAHNNLGVVYEQLGRFDEAMREYEISVRLKPANAAMRNNLEAMRNKMGNR